ncbi:MAG: Fe-S cluster assembly protein SufD, partial [Elusimicrobia bacterium]|nr:Fe-S cluster assembly protein SufD [Elusimicrobiota bacterium]
ALRDEAWEAFRAAPAPSKTSEAWRRVDFGQWRLDALTREHLAIRPAGALPPLELGGAAGVFRQELGSSQVEVALSPEAKAQGVVFCSLEQALASHPRLAEPAMMRCAGEDLAKLEAAAAAGFAGGAFLYVPAGAKVERPFDASFIHPAGLAYGFPRLVVALGDGAEATVVEDHGGGDAGRRVSAAFGRARLGKAAKLGYFYTQTLGAETTHYWSQRVDLAQDAELRHYSILLGGALHKSDLHVELLGSGASSELFGLLFGCRKQVFDARTWQMHRAPRSRSNLLFKTALQDRARSVYTGMIRVDPEAVGCDAYQQNNNLLLSEAARADTTPVLEILTDQVHCKHGATMGPVRAEELFYLGTRGLDPREAARTLVTGFFEPILRHVPLERLKERLPDDIARRIA